MLHLKTTSAELAVDPSTGEITLWDTQRSERLLILPNAFVFIPVLNNQSIEPHFQSAIITDNKIIVHLASDSIENLRVEFQSVGDHFEISSRFTAKSACELNRLNLFPIQTGINAENVVNFRNRHHTHHTWPELLLGGDGCETNTYSTDWQFAPHPTMFIFRKVKNNLFFGALDLPQSFGMYFKVTNFKVDDWYLDYGKIGFGQPLAAGETFVSPRFTLFLDRDKTVYETIETYTSLLIEQSLIPDPAKKKRFEWHTAPLYCTWMDQGYKSNIIVPGDLMEQQAAAGDATKALNESVVREILSVIEREKLPFRSFLLDDGWAVTRGQWEPHPDRFPDLRKVVDDIHARGMKVLVWWNWAELFEDAQAETHHLIGQGKVNRHGCRMRDYSHPSTQEEYLKPLFHKFFSSDPGCYDLDGIKTDFQPDKVHDDMPIYDPTWRGEENYFYKLYQLFYSLMREHKPDACHIGCAGHPYLAEFIDINRTYDVGSSDYREHINRAKMLKATSVGCPVAFDFHNIVENFADYVQAAKDNDCSIEIGNILGMKQDRFSEWEPADAAFLEIIRGIF